MRQTATTADGRGAVDAWVAAIFANQRSWLRQMASSSPGSVSRSRGLTIIHGTYDGSIVVAPGRSASGWALDGAFEALRQRAPVGGVLIWSATSDEPVRMALTRYLLARGCDKSFRPHWMHRDLTDLSDLAGLPGSPGIRIRLAIPGDDGEIAAAADAGTPYTSPHEAAALIAHGRLPVSRQRAWLFLAREERDAGAAGAAGAVVGQVAVHLTRGRRGIAGVYSMGVLPAARRRGIGSALIRAAATFAQRRGATALGLNATPDGERLYSRLGFTAVGDGQTWHLPAGRLGTPPDAELITLAEEIAGGALPTLERFPAARITTTSLPNEESPLAFAARFGQETTARWLLAHGAMPEVMPFWSLGWRDE
ncbi:MAG: GNAT family N-acetyltransferase, partial [Chloroflexia bacterium]|nr:GNAT family N-acetyltransferase [Chloroflexia bacterium]